MTIRQIILKKLYPVLMKLTKKKTSVVANDLVQKPNASFYDLSATLNTGKPFLFDKLRGTDVLIVNTASNCGYTNQYEDLQKLYTQFNNQLIILGFPANDFKEQEKGSDDEIAQFCKINYGVTFPLMQKSSVVKSSEQNAVFEWLSNANLNGWNAQEPTWNFSKYLINKEGVLTHYFDPALSPLDKTITSNLK